MIIIYIYDRKNWIPISLVNCWRSSRRWGTECSPPRPGSPPGQSPATVSAIKSAAGSVETSAPVGVEPVAAYAGGSPAGYGAGASPRRVVVAAGGGALAIVTIARSVPAAGVVSVVTGPAGAIS